MSKLERLRITYIVIVLNGWMSGDSWFDEPLEEIKRWYT